jgi:hypothetical protein
MTTTVTLVVGEKSDLLQPVEDHPLGDWWWRVEHGDGELTGWAETRADAIVDGNRMLVLAMATSRPS